MISLLTSFVKHRTDGLRTSPAPLPEVFPLTGRDIRPSTPGQWNPATTAGLLCAFAALLVVAGCQTTGSSFPSPGADWQTFQGQLHYTSVTGKSIIGDVVIRRSPRGDFQLEFQSGPGFPLMRLWESGNLARTEGVLVRGSWQGPADKAPRKVRGWAKLRESFEHQGHPAHLAASFDGDHFDFHFSN